MPLNYRDGNMQFTGGMQLVMDFHEMGSSLVLKIVDDNAMTNRWSLYADDFALIARNDDDPCNSWRWVDMDEGWQPWDDSDEANLP